jgi:hypothetical protein
MQKWVLKFGLPSTIPLNEKILTCCQFELKCLPREKNIHRTYLTNGLNRDRLMRIESGITHVAMNWPVASEDQNKFQPAVVWTGLG